MASPADHLDQARRNRDLARALLASSPGDPASLQWVVIMAFYTALHCIDAHLVRMGSPAFNHIDRRRQINRPANRIPPRVARSYAALQSRSVDARYRLARFTENEVRNNVLARLLKDVTDFARI